MWMIAGCAFLLAAGSCTTILDSAKYKFNDGLYFTNILSHGKVIVTNMGDSTLVTPMIKANGTEIQDTLHERYFNATVTKLDGPVKTPVFYDPSFDLDLVTIPFKYRPSVQGFPNQLNANYNAALYIGYRTDVYQLDYTRTPIGVYKREVHHFGLSGGVFAGLGNSALNEWTTKPAIDKEYDGVVFTKGIALVGGVQNLSVGLALGFDNLLDPNRNVWLYQNKCWIGVTLGVNLN